MESILKYLCEQETDSTGEAWTLVSRITTDLAFTREEVFTELMKVEGEGLIKVIATLEPGPYGLLSATITDQGRARWQFTGAMRRANKVPGPGP